MEGINQRGNKETKDNPEGAANLHSGDLSICPQDHFKPYTPQSWALRKSGQKKSHCLNTNISEHVSCSPKGMWETPQTYGRRYSGQMRLKFSFFCQIRKTLCLAQTHSEAWWWQHHAVGMFFIDRDWETGQNGRSWSSFALKNGQKSQWLDVPSLQRHTPRDCCKRWLYKVWTFWVVNSYALSSFQFFLSYFLFVSQ